MTHSTRAKPWKQEPKGGPDRYNNPWVPGVARLSTHGKDRTIARPLCIYHRNCLDGLAAAAVVQALHPEAELLPWNYGSQRPSAIGRQVYLLDLALDPEAMQALAAESSGLIWIDHHLTSLALRETLGWGHVDLQESAATLAWRVLCPDLPLPPVLAYIRDKDLWRWQLPDARTICAGLAERYLSPPRSGILAADLSEMHVLGEPIWQRTQVAIQAAAARGVPSREPYGLREVRALVVNDMQRVSDLGEHIYLDEDRGGLGYDLAICFGLRRDGRWIHSLRSLRVDCQRIAVARGGGGHPQAAGYVCDTPFPASADCLDWPA